MKNKKQKHLSIKSWSEQDRPREKMLNKGASALTDAELLAILIGSGSRNETAVALSKRIFADYNNSLSRMGRLTLQDFMKYKGIGEAKAVSIVAALEIGRRRKDATPPKQKKLISSKDSYEELLPILGDLSHEEFWIVLLNRSNIIIKTINISKGGVSATVVDSKLIFKPALELTASNIILAHNHPSGNLKPSEADIKLTNKIREAGNALDITILDHLIITDRGYYSFADEGIL